MEKYYNYTVNENGRLVHYGDKPTDYSTTVLTQKAVAFLRQRAQALLPLLRARLRPTCPRSRHPRTSASSRSSLHSGTPRSTRQTSPTSPGTPTTTALSRAQPLNTRLMSAAANSRRSSRSIALSRRSCTTLPRNEGCSNEPSSSTPATTASFGGSTTSSASLALRALDPRPAGSSAPRGQAGNGTTGHEARPEHRLRIDDQRDRRDTPGGPQDGTSFLPLLEARHVSWRTSYLLEYLGKNKLGDAGPPPYLAIHTSRYLYVEYRHDHWQELYDLSSDPWELRNVAADHRLPANPTPAPR